MPATHRTVTLTKAEADYRDAKSCYDYELRHGTPGGVGRARRYLAEALRAYEAEQAAR